MEFLKDKKISFLMILFSILMLIFGIVTKDYNGNYYRKSRYNSPPLKHYEVTLFGIDFSYINFLLFFIIVLGIGIYLLLYKNDQSIKGIIKKTEFSILTKFQKSKDGQIKKNNFLDRVKGKYSEFEKKSLQIKNETQISSNSNDYIKVPTLVNLITLFALFFTFFMATKIGFTLWFFIILSYFHLINLTPKTKKVLIIKAIGYPLIFWLLFSIILSEDIYSSRFTYMLSKNFIPFIISVVIIYFSQMKRFGKLPTFSIKSPLFWLSLICLLISIFRYGVIKYIENS